MVFHYSDGSSLRVFPIRFGWTNKRYGSQSANQIEGRLSVEKESNKAPASSSFENRRPTNYRHVHLGGYSMDKGERFCGDWGSINGHMLVSNLPSGVYLGCYVVPCRWLLRRR